MHLFTEHNNLLWVWSNHVCKPLSSRQPTTPKSAPWCEAILVRQRVLCPLHVLIPVICRISVFIKNFKPLIHKVWILFSFFSNISVVMYFPFIQSHVQCRIKQTKIFKNVCVSQRAIVRIFHLSFSKVCCAYLHHSSSLTL